MSDTPRTDEQVFLNEGELECVLAHISRELEVENQRMVDLLKKIKYDLNTGNNLWIVEWEANILERIRKVLNE